MPSGDRSLDLVVMTHLDSDHSPGLLDVLAKYEVGAVLTGNGSPDARMYAQWQASMEKNRLEVVPVRRGYQVDLGSRVLAEVLNPRSGPSDESASDGAVVLRVTYRSISFLLTSDIGKDTEANLAARGPELRNTC